MAMKERVAPRWKATNFSFVAVAPRGDAATLFCPVGLAASNDQKTFAMQDAARADRGAADHRTAPIGGDRPTIRGFIAVRWASATKTIRTVKFRDEPYNTHSYYVLRRRADGLHYNYIGYLCALFSWEDRVAS